MYSADLDLLSDNLEVAAAADHPLDGDRLGRRGGGCSGEAGVAQGEAFGERERTGHGGQQQIWLFHGVGHLRQESALGPAGGRCLTGLGVEAPVVVADDPGVQGSSSWVRLSRA